MTGILAVIAGGCSSAPVYPKQIITVIPGTEGTAGEYPTGPAIGPPEQRPSMGETAPPGSEQPVVPPSAGTGATPSHYNQGVMLFREGNTDGAIQQFRMAIAENPNDLKARNNLGVLLEKTGDSHGAIEQYQAVLRLDPKNKLTHRLLARAMAQSGDIDGALDQYETAVKLDPQNAGVHNDFGVALHIRGDDRDAIYQYRQALALDPTDFAAHRNLADAYNETGDTGQAVKEMRIAESLKPDNVPIHNALASLLFEQNNVSAAMQQWQTANRIDPKNPDALAGMSIGYWKMGAKQQSLESYRKAVALAPGYFCDEIKLRGVGHWNGPCLAALHTVAGQPGAPPCSGS